MKTVITDLRLGNRIWLTLETRVRHYFNDYGIMNDPLEIMYYNCNDITWLDYNIHVPTSPSTTWDDDKAHKMPNSTPAHQDAPYLFHILTTIAQTFFGTNPLFPHSYHNPTKTIPCDIICYSNPARLNPQCTWAFTTEFSLPSSFLALNSSI